MPVIVPTIGLEIHAELKTRTKMFCNSKNDPDEGSPNANICPVCLAHPGTLPVINREAVRHVLRVGMALHGALADYTEFDRKNYFYPDLPKGYQLSQYEFPLVSGGELNGVDITRIHLEEDTASSIHDENTGETLIDFNRAGVPLMELVTEPVIESVAQASAFAKELQLLLRYLGASDANMEKGEMRVEANVSVSENSNGDKRMLGTKVEIKNINSFNAMERAVAYEIKRQTELMKRGEKILQETRGWDEGKQATFPQRAKEGSADYRYFPDPDLPSLCISEIHELSHGVLSEKMPELPWEKRSRYRDLGVKESDAAIIAGEEQLAAFFDEVLSRAALSVIPQTMANYLVNDIVKMIRDTARRDTDHIAEMPISARNFLKIIQMLGERKISSRVAKDLLALAASDDRDPEEVAMENGLLQVADASQMSVTIDRLLAEHASVVGDYKKGKTSSLEFLVGQGMKTMRGAADPKLLREMILSKMA